MIKHMIKQVSHKHIKYITQAHNKEVQPPKTREIKSKVGGQAVLRRQLGATTPWLTERHG